MGLIAVEQVFGVWYRACVLVCNRYIQVVNSVLFDVIDRTQIMFTLSPTSHIVMNEVQLRVDYSTNRVVQPERDLYVAFAVEFGGNMGYSSIILQSLFA